MMNLIQRLYNDSLFRNSVFMMASTGIMAGFGFFFWLINAHLFSPTQVGLATTLISVMNLIAILSLAGFDATLIRFLPTSEKPNDQINTAYVVVGSVAFLIAGTLILGMQYISPALVPLLHTKLGVFLFLLGCTMNALNVLTESVFVARRCTGFILAITAVFSIAKMLFPFLFMHWGALGVFAAAAFSQTLGFLVSVAILMFLFSYRPAPTLSRGILSRLWRYSGGNYIAGVLGLLPAVALPIVITNHINPSASAYYYIATMIAGVLYTIPMAAGRASFAESSHDEQAIERHMRSALRIIATFMIPGIAILVIGAGFIMRIFGKEYVEGGAYFLRLLAFTGIAVGATSIFGTFFRVTRHIHAFIAMNLVYAVSILGLARLLVSFGLTGIGFAWLIGNICAALIGYVLYRILRARQFAPIANIIPRV